MTFCLELPYDLQDVGPGPGQTPESQEETGSTFSECREFLQRSIAEINCYPLSLHFQAAVCYPGAGKEFFRSNNLVCMCVFI